jgi:DNA-binding CsgD family transcriptional regulator
MLETVREFGRETLAASGETEDVQRSHAGHYERLVARAEPELTGADQLAWFGRLETEHANLRTALAWTIAHDPEAGLRMAGALIRFWDHHSHLREGQRWLEAALANSGGLPPAPRAKALWGAGGFATGAGDYELAERRLTEGVALARAAGDRYLLGFLYGELGTVALHRGDLARAASSSEEGLAHVRAVGDHDAIAAALGNLGIVALFRGDHAEAVARSEESLALYRRLDSVHGTAKMLGTLGRALLELGDHDRALAVLDEGLVLSQRVGNKLYAISALEGLAAAATAQGAWEHATRLFGAVEALIEGSGIAVHPFDRVANERHLAAVRTHLDEAAFAVAWYAGRALSPGEAAAEALALTADFSDSSDVEPHQVKTPPGARALAPFGLTRREREVLALVAAGKTDPEIAALLSVGRRTAEAHVSAILAKLGVETRAAAAALAVRHGLA